LRERLKLSKIRQDTTRTKKNSMLSQDIIKWCFKEGYRIYPITKDNLTYQVEVCKAHQKALLTETHSKRTIHKAVEDVYIKLYNKQNSK